MEALKVLLVDDEEEFITTLVERLEFRGIAARGFTSGREALACLREERFDVVVADLKMPGIDGFEIKRTVEREFPATKVLLVTGHGGRESGEEDGDLDVLMKPFGIDALLRWIAGATGSA